MISPCSTSHAAHTARVDRVARHPGVFPPRPALLLLPPLPRWERIRLYPKAEATTASLLLEWCERGITRGGGVVPGSSLCHEFTVYINAIDIHPGNPSARTVLALVDHLHGLAEDVVGKFLTCRGAVILPKIGCIDLREPNFVLATTVIQTGHQVAIDHTNDPPLIPC